MRKNQALEGKNFETDFSHIFCKQTIMFSASLLIVYPNPLRTPAHQ